jgi:hypothetical protein
MANKIRKVIEEAVEEVETVLVHFFGHVRHNGHDYQPGDTAEIEPEHAAALVKLGVASEVTGESTAPAPDPMVPDAAPPPDAE